MIDEIIVYLEELSSGVPIEIFVLLGSFVEEVLAPIPSPVVMTLAGSIAQAQNRHILYLLVLSLFGTVGKTLGAWLLYVLADKMEDVVLAKFGKYLGVTHKEVENIGKKLSGGWKDYVILFLARAMPIVPSAPISIGSGLIKINKFTYLSTTFTGTFVRNLMYLYLGFAGLGNYKQISEGFDNVESIGQIVLFLIVASIVGWAYWQRRKNKSH